MEEAVRRLLDAAASDDRTALRLVLHPYLWWTLADGRTLHGRNAVLAHLTGAHGLSEPSSYELRDGQLYRWVEPPEPG